MRKTDSARSLADVELDEFGRPVHRSRLKTYASKLTANVSSLGYITLLLLISFLPYGLAYFLATWIGRARYARHRDLYATRAMMMEMRLGGTPEQIDRWLCRAVELSVLEDLEVWLLPRLTPADVSRVVRFEGKEQLDDALARGKGVVLYTGHVWSAYTVLNSLGLLGYRISLFKRERFGGRHNWIEQRFYDRRVRLMERLKFRLLYTTPPSPLVAAQATNSVRRGEISCALVDARRLHPDDVFVDFLGQPTNFPQVPSMIARITGAPLIGMWAHRDANQVPLTIRFSEPLTIKGNHVSSVQEMANFLDREIRADPPSWSNWLFRVFAL